MISSFARQSTIRRLMDLLNETQVVKRIVSKRSQYTQAILKETRCSTTTMSRLWTSLRHKPAEQQEAHDSVTHQWVTRVLAIQFRWSKPRFTPPSPSQRLLWTMLGLILTLGDLYHQAKAYILAPRSIALMASVCNYVSSTFFLQALKKSADKKSTMHTEAKSCCSPKLQRNQL